MVFTAFSGMQVSIWGGRWRGTVNWSEGLLIWIVRLTQWVELVQAPLQVQVQSRLWASLGELPSKWALPVCDLVSPDNTNWKKQEASVVYRILHQVSITVNFKTILCSGKSTNT